MKLEHQELRTYRDLRLFLMSLDITHPALDQPLQAVCPTSNADEHQTLLPVIAIGSIREFGIEHTVSSYNGQHEADDWVLLMDSNGCEPGHGPQVYTLDELLAVGPDAGS